MSTFDIPSLDKPTTAVIVVDQNGDPVSFGGGGTSEVEVTNFPTTQAVTGPLTDTQLRASAVPVSGPVTEAELTAVVGLLSAGAYSDDTGAADGSVIGLLKGIYVQNAAIISLLTQIETNTSA